jgi:hypothetical protein
MKRLVPLLLILLGAPAAFAGSSAGAIASARIVRPTATIGLPTAATAAIVVSSEAGQIHLPVTAGGVDLALEIGAAPAVSVTDNVGGSLLVSRTSSPATARVVTVTIHNR